MYLYPTSEGRLFLRTCLVKRYLPLLVDLFVNETIDNRSNRNHFHNNDHHHNNDGQPSHYDPSTSILGNDILVQIFASLVRQLATFQFHLDLDNASFLDVR